MARAMFSLTLRSGTMPSVRRSSGENPMPLRMAAFGDNRERTPPPMRIVPDVGLSAPKNSRAASVLPEPNRPASPSTSPLRMSRSKGLTAPTRPSLRASTRGLLVSTCSEAAFCTNRASTSLAFLPSMFHKPQFGQFGGLEDANKLAVTQDRDAIVDFVNLIQKVRDEYNPDALGTESPHHGEEFLDLAFIEARCRLVHHKHLALHIHRTGDADHLPDGDRIIGDRPGDIYLQTEALHRRQRPAVHLAPSDRAEERLGLATNKDILGHALERQKTDFLVNRADARYLSGNRRRGLERLAIEDHRARVE